MPAPSGPAISGPGNKPAQAALQAAISGVSNFLLLFKFFLGYLQ